VVGDCLSWAHNGLVAYGAGSAVALYDTESARLVHTLHAHKNRVNCVRFLREMSSNGDTVLLSGSSDATVRVWSRSSGAQPLETRLSSTFKDKGPVASVDGLVWTSSSLNPSSSSCEHLIVVSCGADMNVWWREASRSVGEQEWRWLEAQCLVFAPWMITDVSVCRLDGDTVALAAGGADHDVHVFVQRGRGEPLRKVDNLDGHQEWVRSVAFVRADDGDVLLASAAQDNYIRLWRITTDLEKVSAAAAAVAAASAATAAGDDESGVERDDMYKVKARRFKVGGVNYALTLESVLAGHEDWVQCVCWPPVSADGRQPLALLSASMDRTMMIWTPDEHSGLWINEHRVGTTGGNTLGFYGCAFGNECTTIIGHGYTGELHMWHQKSNESAAAPSSSVGVYDNEWVPAVTVSGHRGAVVDCDWESPNGGYLVSASTDQTVRLFAPWQRRQADAAGWHELARPQVHGYNMTCLAFVKSATPLHKYASAAEEKVVRVFEAPQSFVRNLAAASAVDVDMSAFGDRPLGANMPALGLSNKPLFDDQEKEEERVDDDDDDDDNDGNGRARAAVDRRAAAVKLRGNKEGEQAQPVLLDNAPPVEAELMQRTLWAEERKLYGHPNHMLCVASSHCGDLLASACRASQASEAHLILWRTDTWKQVAMLPAHKLSVTQLEFSPDDTLLASVSRDRTLSIFERAAGSDDIGDYQVIARVKAHERIIWSCSWSHDSRLLATAARDKRVKIWMRTGDNRWATVARFSFKSAATACAFSPADGDASSSHTLAIGLESGVVALAVFSVADDGESKTDSLTPLPVELTHCDAVRRIRWRNASQLATCSLDHSVRIFSFIR
jgi:elongator complex protein 2